MNLEYLPKVVTNEFLEKLLIRMMNGFIQELVLKRRKVEVKLQQICYTKAALAAIKVKYDKNKIDLIIVATFTNDVASPSRANLFKLN